MLSEYQLKKHEERRQRSYTGLNQKNVGSDKTFSCIAFLEDGIESKMVIPYHWVNHTKMVMYFPPDGALIANYVTNWTTPSKHWRRYTVLKFLLKQGTQNECKAVHRSPDSDVQTCAEDADEYDSDRTITPPPLETIGRATSPKISLKHRQDAYSPPSQSQYTPSQNVYSPSQNMRDSILRKVSSTQKSPTRWSPRSKPPPPECKTPPQRKTPSSPQRKTPQRKTQKSHSPQCKTPPPQRKTPSQRKTQQSHSPLCKTPPPPVPPQRKTPSPPQRRTPQRKTQRDNNKRTPLSPPQRGNTPASLSPPSPPSKVSRGSTTSDETLRRKAHSSPSMSRSTPLPLGDGGSVFREMEPKRFQYNVLMRLGGLEATLMEVKALLKRVLDQSEPVESMYNFPKINTKEEFVQFDEKLKDPAFFSLTVKRLSRIGIIKRNINATIAMLLDETLELIVQVEYNRDGTKRELKNKDGTKKMDTKNKHAFPTYYYRAMRDAVIQSGEFTVAEFKAAMLEVLKRAPAKKKAADKVAERAARKE